jgi:hypothetical protein
MPTRYTLLTAFAVLNDGTSEDQPERNRLKRSYEVTSQEMGGSGIDDDEVPMSSVVYMGRGSFRMEAVAIDSAPQLGVVQAVTGSVTAPLHAAPRMDRDRNSGSNPDGAPALRALFSSQVDVPVLAAPTGSVNLRAPAVTLSRGLLTLLCGLVLLCGIVVGTAARHLFASPAPLAVVAMPAVAAPSAPAHVPPAPPAPPAIVALPSLPAADRVPPSPPVVAVAAPVTIHVRMKAVGKAAPAPVAMPKTWVDPWAD